MKRILIGSLMSSVLMAATGAWAAPQAETLLRCESPSYPRMGFSVMKLVYPPEEREEIPPRFYNEKGETYVLYFTPEMTEPMPLMAHTPLVSEESIILTFSVTSDHYAHFYMSGETVLVDLNVDSDFNTDGPALDYACRETPQGQ